MILYALASLVWRTGKDKNGIPYQEAWASKWFDGEPVTFRKYSRNYVIAYHGETGVDEWTQDGEGDGLIETGIIVIVKRIPIDTFENETAKCVKELRPVVFDIGLEYGTEYTEYDPDDDPFGYGLGGPIDSDDLPW